MILNNYWTFKAYVESHYYKQMGGPEDRVGESIGLKSLDGLDARLWIGSGVNYSDFLSTELATKTWSPKVELSVILGSGTTAPTPEDYNIEQSIMSAISNFNSSINVTSSNGQEKTVITVSGTNTSNDAITISEIGIVKPIRPDNINDPRNVLFIRHLLDEPKSVASGEGFALTFEWTEQ